MSKILGYFTEDEIYYHGKKQPPRNTKILNIGCNPMFSIEDYAEDEDIQVLSEDENWYTIKKKDIILGEC